MQQNISNIIPIITTPPTKKQPNRQYITKIEKHVEILKTKILIPSRPRTDYSIEPTNEKHTCKILTCNSHTQNPITSVTNGTPSTYSFPQESHTVVLHDPKKVHNTNLTQTRTVGVDNTHITSNRRHHPPRIKPFTLDS